MKSDMDKSLLNLFEQNEQDFRNELSLMLLPRDNKKLQCFMSDFFVNKVSVEEYKKELSMGEISMLNSVLKVIALPISLINNNPATPSLSGRSQKNGLSDEQSSPKDNPVFSFLDLKTLGTTAAGGVIGGMLFKTWGGVLLSLAGCALGMHLSSSPSRAKQKQIINRGLNVDKYIQTLKGMCKGIDEVILNYHVGIDNIIKQYENAPKPSFATAYKPLLDRMASLYISVESASLQTDIKNEFDKLFRTLKNHHFEILNYNNETKRFYSEIESPHVKENTVVKAAILEDGVLFEQGECLIPKK